jgi:medium-chain acyl-[acyl-carrier-protein] hydrolase
MDNASSNCDVFHSENDSGPLRESFQVVNPETPHPLPVSAGQCFVRLHHTSVPPRLRLYCLPYAGGSARVFQSWRNILPPDISLVGVEYPGRGGRISELAIDRIDILAGQLVDALAEAPPGPYALFGHSMGALAAFEMSHQLASRRAPAPILLAVSGHGAASLPSSDNPVHASPDDAFLARLRELNATPPEVLEMPDLLELMLPILRADFCAAETYVPVQRPKLGIPIIAYGGLRDPDVHRDQLLAWQNETTARCTVRMFPGDHFFLRTARDNVVRTLVHDLIQALQATTDHTVPRSSELGQQ